ncbi:MAG: peptide deformylase [Candidatus Zambryskibacteria bacterium]|nr:peptide deformylase [Candidatus Zambryskibacteria bacterium]
MTEILQKDAPVLRKKAKAVSVKDIGSKKIRSVVERMRAAMHAEEDGVAIAAPQIGESLRIFVVNGKIFSSEDLVFINPEIIKFSKKKRGMEEGCLSLRWLYGQVRRSEKITIKAYNEKGRLFQRGASGLLAQIFQHEIDHLDGILFTDKAKNVRDLPPNQLPKFVFFGSSTFSKYILEELEKAGFSPILNITTAKKLPALPDADVFIIASFGKILPKEIIDLPKHGSLNVHPSLLPKLRGPSPIQNIILGLSEPGVSIMKMNEKMDEGPVLTQEKVPISPWPDHYNIVEEKLGRAGGKLLAEILPKWINGKINIKEQNVGAATYTKLIKKEDGLLNLDDPAEMNLRKVLAYSTWPGAYINFKRKNPARHGFAVGESGGGKEVRVIIKDAEIEGGRFVPIRVIPAGKREMNWQDFLRGNS